MLPRLLCEQLCSLNPDEDRLAFSVIWKMTETGEVKELHSPAQQQLVRNAQGTFDGRENLNIIAVFRP